MKKSLISLLLLAMMLFTVAIPALAADVPGPAFNDNDHPQYPGKTVTIKNSDPGHTYEAYQIFKGDLVTEYEQYDLTGFTAYKSDGTACAVGDAVAYYSNGTDKYDVIDNDLLHLTTTAPDLSGLTLSGNDYKDSDNNVVYTKSGKYLLDKDGNVAAYTNDGGTSYVVASKKAVQTADDRTANRDIWYVPGNNNDGKKAVKKTLTNVDFGANLDYAKVVDGKTLIGALNDKWTFGIVEPADYTALDDAARKNLAEEVVSALGELDNDPDGPELADIFNKYLKLNEGKPYASADTPTNNEYKLKGLEEGYYFIKDKDDSLTGTGKDKAYTDFILRVVEDEEVNAKADVPDIEKKILEAKDVNTGELSQAYGKRGADGIIYVVTDPAEIKENPDKINEGYLYHAIRTSGQHKGKQLYYYVEDGSTAYHEGTQEEIDANPAYHLVRPVFTFQSEATVDGETDPVKLDKIMRNANGDVYTLRVDENSASIGEWVRYEIVSNIPKMEGYSKYFFVMNDTLSAGLSFPYDPANNLAPLSTFQPQPPHNFVVNIEYADGTLVPLTLKSFDSTTPENNVVKNEKSVYYKITDVTADGEYKGGKAIELVFNDFIQYSTPDATHGKAVRVVLTYDVLVNNKAIISNPGNPNKVDLTYSRNPNVKPDSETNKPNENDTDITGKTPERIVRTYVTELILKKVGEDGLTNLSGAKFKISGTRYIPIVSLVEEYIKYEDTNNDNFDDTHTTVPQSQVVHWELTDGSFTDQAPIFDSYDSGTNTFTRGNYFKYKAFEAAGGTVTNGVPNPQYGVGSFVGYKDSENNDYAGTTYATQAAALTALNWAPTHYHYCDTVITYQQSMIGSYRLAAAGEVATHYATKGANYATDNTDIVYVTDDPTAATADSYIDYDGSNLTSITKKYVLDHEYIEKEVGANGTLDLSGLGAGDYVIEETVAPEGYNLLRDKIYVRIRFTTDDDAETTSTAEQDKDKFTVKYMIGGDPATASEDAWKPVDKGIGVTVTRDDGSTDAETQLGEGQFFQLKIKNKQGSELPETGGIGTTILYIVGAALVLFAGVILVVRKRVSKEK